MAPYYGVRIGREVGVYSTWEECKVQVNGYPNAQFKKFPSRQLAYQFITQPASSVLQSQQPPKSKKAPALILDRDPNKDKEVSVTYGNRPFGKKAPIHTYSSYRDSRSSHPYNDRPFGKKTPARHINYPPKRVDSAQNKDIYLNSKGFSPFNGIIKTEPQEELISYTIDVNGQPSSSTQNSRYEPNYQVTSSSFKPKYEPDYQTNTDSYESSIKKYDKFEQVDSDSSTHHHSRKRNLRITQTDVSQPLVIYTDGACRGNGGDNGCAGVGVYFGHDDIRNVSERLQGKQTNNRAELTAILRALEKAQENVEDDDIRVRPRKLVIMTDSKYSINSLTNWIFAWVSNGWKLKNDDDVQNKDLLQRILELIDIQEGRVEFKYVKGHSSSHGNEMADTLAVKGARKKEVQANDDFSD